MTTIITRQTGPYAKGSPLTNAELDSNFINLNDYKFANTGGEITGNVQVTGTANISGQLTVNNNIRVTQDLIIGGNVYISGNATTISSNTIIVDDPIIYVANNNPGNLYDIGVVGNFTSAYYQHTGIVRDASDGKWKFFSNVISEPTTTVDFTNAVYDTLKIGALETDTATIGGLGFAAYTQSIYNKANGAVQSGWTTITANGTSVTPASNTDTLNITTTKANGVKITTTSNPDTVDFGLETSGVASGVYGSATNIPVLTVDTFGRVTSAANASVSTTYNLAANSGTGSVSGGGTLTINGGPGIWSFVTGSTVTLTNTGVVSLATGSTGRITVSSANGSPTIDLATTGVTAKTYGDGANVASFTVDSYGRITAVSNTAITVGASISDDTTTNSPYYPLFITSTSGTLSAVKVSSSKLNYNPSTGVLTSTSFSGAGTGLTGTAANLTANVSNYDAVTTATTGTYYPQLALGISGTYATYANSAFSFNAATGALSATTLNGTIGTAYQNTITTMTGLTRFGTSGVITTASGDMIISGNLTVNGTTTTINANTVTTNDKNINLANNQTTSALMDGAGIDVGSNQLVTWRYNHATTSWQSNVAIMPTITNTLSLGGASNYWSNMYATNIYGTLQTASQPNITANVSTYDTVTTATTGTYYPAMFSAVTGTLANYANNAISFNAATGALTATSFSGAGTGLTGTAANLTANVSSYDTITTATTGTYYPTMVSAVTGTMANYANNAISFNAATGQLSSNTANITSVAVSTTNTTGALLVTGGVGVRDSVYVGNRVGFANTTQSFVYQVYNATLNSLDTIFG